jgi:hypothetical protein
MFFSLALTLTCNCLTDETFFIFYLRARALRVAPYSNFSSLRDCVGLKVPQGLQAIHHMCVLLPTTTTAVLVSLVSDDA